MPIAAATCQQSTIHVAFQLLLGSIWNNGLCGFRFYFWFLTLKNIWLPQPIMRIQDPKKIWSRNRSLLNLLCKFAILLTFWGLERGYPMTCFKQPSVQANLDPVGVFKRASTAFPMPIAAATCQQSMLHVAFQLLLGSIWNNGLCVCVFRFYFWFLTLEMIAPANHEDSGSQKKMIEKSCPIKSIM